MRVRLIKYCICSLLLLIIAMPLARADEKPPKPQKAGHGHRKVDLGGLLTGLNSSVHYLVGGYVEGAYTQMLHTHPEVVSNTFGGSYGVGLLFELQHFYLKCQTGIGIRRQFINTHIQDFHIYDHSVSDAMGYPYHLRYDFQDWKDQSSYFHVQIPCLLGTSYKYFYGLAGVKLNMLIAASNKVDAICSTSATYDSFLGIFEEMDNHGLRKEVPVSSKGNALPLKFDLIASLELGCEFALSPKDKLEPRSYVPYDRVGARARFALFCDIGTLSMSSKASQQQIVEIPEDYKWDFQKFKLNHMLASDMLSNVPLRNFYAGLRLTLFLDITVDDVCKICGDNSIVPSYGDK